MKSSNLSAGKIQSKLFIGNNIFELLDYIVFPVAKQGIG